MNFSVIRGADTFWGRTFAVQLAKQKRHLILLGRDLSVLEACRNELLELCDVQVHCLEADESDTRSIITVCERINMYFEVDMLVNYTETGFFQKLMDYDVFSLDKKLNENYAAGTLYTHQLLPNLVLHGHAYILNLWCSQHPASTWEKALLAFNMRFSEYINSECKDSNLTIGNFALRQVTDCDSVLRNSVWSVEAADTLHCLYYGAPQTWTEHEK